MTAWFDPRIALLQAAQLDLPLPPPVDNARASSGLAKTRQVRGQTSYLAGLAAEGTVERHYIARGLSLLARRWRGARAEIDLIFADGAAIVFVEVKKSRCFETALLSLGSAQRRRIMLAATEFLGRTVSGQLTDMRFDLAMVNDIGALEILENAFGEND
ncbi:YraN family protein [Seohaeicola saemankumensis]|uniref:YraN family protein n=1 Tax=Seohaeicola saemankumensis TaxID=481181 RepID=UPI001E655532|nr:YraN family protein [Seohaeicola saemankumensis]MCD1627192.1 YraN family protein [Seohaeicola saemankumensis]